MTNLSSQARPARGATHRLARPLAALGLLLAWAGTAQAQTTFTFTAPGGPQPYTVPAGVTKLQVTATGASGGNRVGANSAIAYGAQVQATVTVVPGEVLTVVVGGVGGSGGYLATAAGGYNGGGSGSNAGGGGGATDLRRTGTSTGDYLGSRNALLVAGGGGGSAYASTGGNGGTPTGGDGAGLPGSGATTTAHGAGTTGTDNSKGGNANGTSNGTTYNSGGGGGYYGGGGVANDTNFGTGGGGGSSYVLPTGASNISYAVATTLGNGMLSITPVAPPNNALAFDGSDDYVHVSTALPATSLFTLEGWVNPTTLNNGFNVLLNGDNFPTGTVHCQFLNNGHLRFTISGMNDMDSPFTVPLGRWSHVAVVYSATAQTLQFYLNGTLVGGTLAYGGGIAVASQTYSLGAWLSGSPQRFFAGRYDEVRVYNTTLTAAQVQADMFSATSASPGNQVAYYNFDQGVAGGNNAGVTSLTDQTGNGNTGTLNNFALTGTTSNWVRSFPTITGLSPVSGNVGTAVTVTGTNLTDATGIAFNGTSATSFGTPVSDLTTVVNVPTGATTGPVSVASATLTKYNGPVFTVTATTAVTWTGTTSTDWATASNWSPAVVPTTGIDVTIPAAPANQPVVSGNQVSRNLTVAPGARLTLAANAKLGLGDINSNPTANLLLGSGSTFTQGAGSEIYITGNFTNNGATFALDALSEIGFGLAAGNTHLLNGTTGFTVQTLSVGEQGTNDALTIQVPMQVRRALEVFNSGTVSAGTSGSILLLSDASGTALLVNTNGGVVNGPVTMQRYLDGSLNTGPGYRHFSTPVSGATVASLSTATSGFTPVLTQSYNTSATPGTTTPFPNVFGYDQSRLVSAANSNYSSFDKGFVVPADVTTALTTGQGYAVNIAANQTVSFVGTPFTGNLSQTLSRGADFAAGWQLVGNPYPAPLDYSLVIPADRAGLDAAVYVVQSTGPYTGGYRTYVNGQSTTGTNNPLIASSQGFFVRVSTGNTSGSLTFRNSQRVTSYVSQAAFQRTAADTRPTLRLALAGAGLADAFVAYAETGATAAFDSQYDAGKLANSTGLNLSSTLAADHLAIDGRATFTTATSIALAVGVPAAGSYSLSALTISNLPTGLAAYLRDAQTGQTVLLSQGTSYSFSVTAAQAQALIEGRFTLQFSASTALATAASLSAAVVSVYPNPAHERFTVAVPALAQATSVQAELLNTLGQVVRRQAAALPAAGTTLTVETAGLATGVYTLRLQAGASTLAKRVVIQ